MNGVSLEGLMAGEYSPEKLSDPRQKLHPAKYRFTDRPGATKI